MEPKLCPICLDSKILQRTECNHEFCNDCIYEWSKRSDTCPLCRSTKFLNENEKKRVIIRSYVKYLILEFIEFIITIITADIIFTLLYRIFIPHEKPFYFYSLVSGKSPSYVCNSNDGCLSLLAMSLMITRIFVIRLMYVINDYFY